MSLKDWISKIEHKQLNELTAPPGSVVIPQTTGGGSVNPTVLTIKGNDPTLKAALDQAVKDKKLVAMGSGSTQTSQTKPTTTPMQGQPAQTGQPAAGQQGMTESMEDSPVANAIIRRIMNSHLDLINKFGSEKVIDAINDVADFVGDVEEIGSSDVSGWIRQIERQLGDSDDISEVITKKTSAGDIISDFVHSDDPRFADDSKKERIKRALGAYYGMHPEKSTKESATLKEGMEHSSMSEALKHILDAHPHEHKMCQEGWGMDESLYEALCDHYFREGKIPRKIWHGPLDELRSHVEECYAKDTGMLLGEDDDMLDEDDLTENPAVGAVLGTVARSAAPAVGMAIGNKVAGAIDKMEETDHFTTPEEDSVMEDDLEEGWREKAAAAATAGALALGAGSMMSDPASDHPIINSIQMELKSEDDPFKRRELERDLRRVKDSIELDRGVPSDILKKYSHQDSSRLESMLRDSTYMEDTMNESKFSKLKSKLAKQPGITDPAALAAKIGREKLGQKEMTRRSVAARTDEATSVTDYDPKSHGGTRTELLAKYATTGKAKDAEAARKAGATQKELQAAKRKLADKQNVLEVTKRTEKGLKHTAEPGGYGRKYDTDDEGEETSKSEKSTEKRGRGRPKKDSGDSSTKEKYSGASELQSMLTGKLPGGKLPGKAGKKHSMDDKKTVKEDAQISEWNRQLRTMLSEGYTLTTSVGQEGGHDSVSITASDEDARTLMSMLKNAGIGSGKLSAMDAEQEKADDMPMTHDHEAHDSGSIYGGSVYPDSSEVVQTDASSCDTEMSDDDAQHSRILDIIRKMSGQPLEEENVEEGNEYIKARLDAIKAGKDSFEAGGKVHKVTGDTSDEKKMEEDIGQSAEEDVAAEEEGEAEAEAESSNKETMEEGVEHCESCGDKLEEGHECSMNEERDPTRAGIKVGEKVRLTNPNASAKYEVVKIEGDKAHVKKPDGSIAVMSLDRLKKVKAQARTAKHETNESSLNEWANSPVGRSSEEQFTADIDFMTKVISGGLNGSKSTGQTTVPVIASQLNRQITESDNTVVFDMKKLAGIIR